MEEPKIVFIALGDCVVEVKLVSENKDGVLVQLIGWRIAGQSQIRWPTYHTDWDSAADEAARNFHAYVAACRAGAVTDRHDANDLS